MEALIKDDIRRGRNPRGLRQMVLLRRASERVAEIFYKASIEEGSDSPELSKMAKTISKEISKTYSNLFNEESHLPDEIRVQTGKLPPQKAGAYKYPGKHEYGTLIVDEDVLKVGKQWVRLVLTHELCHAAIGKNVKDDHGEKFKTLATAMGLPEKFQD